MSQILRIQGQVFHIPSIARTRLYSSLYLGRPCLLVMNHSGMETTLQYRTAQWDQAKRDYLKLEACRSACYEALKQIPLMEESEVVNPLVESERQLR
jgi:hypothetical protein